VQKDQTGGKAELYMLLPTVKSGVMSSECFSVSWNRNSHQLQRVIYLYREVINFMGHYMALCFMASSVVHAGKSVYDLSKVDGSYQLKSLLCTQL
jgi:hypothetical protein